MKEWGGKGGAGQIDPPPPRKVTLKNPSLIRVSIWNNEIIGSTKELTITKDENEENVPYLENAEVS